MCGHVGSHLQRLVHGSAGHALGAPAGKLAQSRFCSCSSSLTSTMVTGRCPLNRIRAVFWKVMSC